MSGCLPAAAGWMCTWWCVHARERNQQRFMHTLPSAPHSLCPLPPACRVAAENADRMNTFIALQFLFDRFWSQLKVGGCAGWAAEGVRCAAEAEAGHARGCCLLALILLLWLLPLHTPCSRTHRLLCCLCDMM